MMESHAPFRPGLRKPGRNWRASMAILALGAPLLGQEAQDTRTLEQILNTPLIIASKLPQRVDAAPSIVSAVTRADIERYGWRDLASILKALPGFDFGLDGTGLIGLSERGIWAHEGKALVMVDGICVSPLHNGNVNYYGFIPSQMVERVEVIRGPGSAVYGQFAGVTVINVITRDPESGNQGRFALRGTTLGAGNDGQGAFVSISGQQSEHVSYSLNAGYQTDPFSNRPYVDTFFTGQSFPQDRGNARRENGYVVATVKALGTEVQIMRTGFQIAQVDGAGNGPLDPTVPGLAPGVTGSGARVVQGVRVSHPFALGHDFVLEATAEDLENDMGVVYPESRVGDGVFTSGDTRTRFTGDLTLKWTPNDQAHVLLGGGTIQDWERSVNLQNQGALRSPSDPAELVPQITMDTHYLYGEYEQTLSIFGVTAGGRYEDNPIGHAFAPRLGLTCADGPWNAKLLYGEAFREPTIFQEYSTLFAYTGTLVKPELIRTTEFEFGWRFNPSIVGRINAYRIAVTHTIQGALDQAGDYFIQNEGSIHSKGLEAELDVRHISWGLFGNLSITRPDGEVVPFYLASDGRSFLGLPPVKINLGGYFQAGPLQVAPSLLCVSSREAQTPASANSGSLPGSVLPALIQSQPLPARLIANLAITWNHLMGPGTTLRFSIENLGNSTYPLIQPYYGGHAPLPANDRRCTLDATWRF